MRPALFASWCLGHLKVISTPVGVMSARLVARGVIFLAKRDIRKHYRHH